MAAKGVETSRHGKTDDGAGNKGVEDTNVCPLDSVQHPNDPEVCNRRNDHKCNCPKQM